MSDAGTNEIWILGATGNVGRALAERLARAGIDGVVLVGRSDERLKAIVDRVGGKLTTRQLKGFEEMLAAVKAERPHVVVNLLGSYAETAVPLAVACMPNGNYVDLSIDNATLADLVGLDDRARQMKSTVIGGAGFGVLATEALIVRLCDGMPAPIRVQIDALSSYASEEGVMGEAFAATAVSVMTIGGQVYRDGHLVAVPLGSNLRKHRLPDGTTVKSAAVPSGELFAARQASGAPMIDFTSALAPTSPVIRSMLPLMNRLLKLAVVRRMLTKSMASSRTKKAPRPRPYSWGHAVIDWSDGTTREGWLRTEDAMEYTADVLMVVVGALLAETAPRGAYTPAAAFGPELAIEAGATFVDA